MVSAATAWNMVGISAELPVKACAVGISAVTLFLIVGMTVLMPAAASTLVGMAVAMAMLMLVVVMMLVLMLMVVTAAAAVVVMVVIVMVLVLVLVVVTAAAAIVMRVEQ